VKRGAWRVALDAGGRRRAAGGGILL